MGPRLAGRYPGTIEDLAPVPTSYAAGVILRVSRATTCLAGLVLAGTLAGCSSDGPEQVAAGHSHAGGAMVSMPVGDGTTSSEVGYSLAGLQVREQPDGIGEVWMPRDVT